MTDLSSSLVMNIYLHPKLEVCFLVMCAMARSNLARNLPQVNGHIRHAQRFLNLSSEVCYADTFNNQGYVCCSGRVLPANHPKLKCLKEKPFKSSRTKIKCEQKAQLLSKYSKKYGCCKDRRYKRSRLLCHRGSTYKPLKIPCPPGFQPSELLVLAESQVLSYDCEGCPPGSYSSRFGLEKCLNCTRCQHVIRECRPDRDSQCRKISEIGSRNACTGKKCRARKGKRRRKKLKGHVTPRKRLLKVVTERVSTSTSETTSTLRTNSAFTKSTPLAVGTESLLQPRRCCKLNATSQPHEENATLFNNDIDFDEIESWPDSKPLPTIAIAVLLSALLLFCGMFASVLAIRNMRKESKQGPAQQPGVTATIDGYCAFSPENPVYCELEQADFLSHSDRLEPECCRVDIVQQSCPAPPSRTTGGHRRCRSDSFIMTGSSISFLYAKITESEPCHKKWQFVLDLAVPRPAYKPQNVSLNDLFKTVYCFPDWLNETKVSCSLASFDNVFSDTLEFWKLLPSMIKQIEKSSSYSKMNSLGCLFRDQFTQTSLKKTNRRNLLGGEWDREGRFDHSGGTLEKTGSAVGLTVPAGAVPDGMAVKIHGKVFTNLDRFYHVFKLQPGEHFVSPVVEFVENRRSQFYRHVIVKIPVSECDLDDRTFQVLCVPGDGDTSVTTVPRNTPRHKATPDVYYDVIEDGFVHVYTKHFTAFACSSCNRDKIYLEGVVMGRTRHMCGMLTEVTIRLFICDKLHLIKDFLTVLEKNQQKFDFHTLDAKTLQLHKTVDENDQLCTSLELSDRSQDKWKPRTRRSGQSIFDNSKKTISSVISCETLSELPEIGGEWTYESESEPVFMECFLDVDHLSLTTENAPLIRTTYDIIVKPPNMPKAVYQENNVAAASCNSLAIELEIREARNFAREMGVPDSKTELIFHDFRGDGLECKYRVVSSCFKHLGPDVFRQKLPEVLTNIGRLDIVQKYSHCQLSVKEEPSCAQADRVNTKLETDV